MAWIDTTANRSGHAELDQYDGIGVQERQAVYRARRRCCIEICRRLIEWSTFDFWMRRCGDAGLSLFLLASCLSADVLLVHILKSSPIPAKLASIQDVLE